MVIGRNLLNKSATVTRPNLSSNSDNQGGDGESQVSHPSDPDIRIRYFAATGADQIVAGREDERVSHVAYVLPTVSIIREDRITVDSKTFTVVAALPPSKTHHIKLQLRELHSDA